MILIFQTRARPPDIRDGCSNPRSGRDNFPTSHRESKPDIIWPGDRAAGPRPQAEDPLCEHDHRQQERTPNILLFHGRGLLRSLQVPDCLNVWVPPAPRAENAKIDVKVIGASQEMCNYLPLLQKLPAALVIRKVKVTKHSSRVSLREIFT